MIDPDLKGIIAAVLTPVTAKCEIDLPRFEKHIRSMLAQGCTYVSTFGTTGEGASFSAREKHAAHEGLIGRGISPESLVPAIITTALDDAVQQLNDAVDLGIRRVLVLPPFYYASAPQQGLIDFLEALYERAGRPQVGIILYNIPAMSRITISIELVRALTRRAILPVVGIKDSTGDLANGLALASELPRLSIFTGDDRVLPFLVAAGGAGLIGGMPNLYAGDIVALYRAVGSNQQSTLAAKAAERIARIDAEGGLIALKANLARELSDPDWARTMPPLASALENKANAA